MPLTRIRHVRGRLLALLALIVAPLSLVSVIIATTTYRTVTQSIEMSQVQTASNYTIRARIWFRGALRTAFAAGATVAAAKPGQAACDAMVDTLINQLEGFSAMRVVLSDGQVCTTSRLAGVGEPELRELARVQRLRPVTSVIAGPLIADARYDVTSIPTATGSRSPSQVVVHAMANGAHGPPFEVMMLINPALLDQTFEIGTFFVGSAVAVIKPDGEVMVARGIEEKDRTWLPNEMRLSSALSRWDDNVGGQERRSYVSDKLFEPDLYVLARFEDTARRAAALQFWILCLIPLAILSILGMAYSFSIQRDVVGWMQEIEKAAIANTRSPDALTLARLGAGMPLDIRRVAESYNSMAASSHRREQDLRRALNDNFELMRELHHRVKNSLQVIQSYLALSRRLAAGDKAAHIAETGLKVQVLSAAYRLSLTDQGLKPAPVNAFVHEIIGNLTSSSRKSGQWIETRIETDAQLIVDRMIPLGLAIVEATLAGLRAPGAEHVTLQLTDIAGDRLELIVSTDGPLLGNEVSPRLLSGLATQLEAKVHPTEPKHLLNWSFAP